MVLMRVLTVQLLKLVVLALFMKGDITVRIVCGVVEPGLFFFFFFKIVGGLFGQICNVMLRVFCKAVGLSARKGRRS